MTVVIPATVTNLEEAFKGCSSLTEVTLEHSYTDLANTVNMTNAFEGCTSLTKVICHNQVDVEISETNYHAFRLALDSTNQQASVQCFDTNGEAVLKENNVATDIIVPYGSGTDLELTKKTNLLGYSSSLTDDKVSKMMDNKVPITSNSQTLDPESKTFVLWGEEDGQGNANFKTNLSLAGAVIDDTITSTSKTWSSEKITSEMYPLGFIYMQLYNPTLATLEKSPIQLGMTPASGCKWEEITSDFASYPYLKIGSGTTQSGHNKYHNHGGYTEYSNPRHVHGQNVTANVGGTAFRRDYVSDGSSYSYPQGCTTDYADINHRHQINYDGDSTEQTVEVNASNMKIWKVVADI